MKRRVFVGSAFAGAALTGAYAKPQKPQAGSIPTRTFGKTGVKVHMIAQGGARKTGERLLEVVQDGDDHGYAASSRAAIRTPSE